MNDRLKEIGHRTVVVSNADGDPMFRIKVLHAAGLGAVALMAAPRATAAVALGMLFRGISLDIEDQPV